jgi:hypothetical protein
MNPRSSDATIANKTVARADKYLRSASWNTTGVSSGGTTDRKNTTVQARWSSWRKQAISRFDRWSLSVTAIFHQQSGSGC